MSVFNSYFDNNQVTLLLLGGMFFLLSLFMQIRNKELYSFIFIIFTALCVFIFSAILDPFLNIWDERFHALVAKNLMKHPLMPTLYDDPVVDMAYDRWDRYHIWLHKQPLFLWQIALSFKIFGISEFTLRLPNIILGVILVAITYRSGKLLVNKQVGYIASLLLISTIYVLELIAGRQELEHNDFSFLTYVSLSIWSFIEYYHTKKKYWIYFIGFFSGMAILCKWLVGLLVYFGWFIIKIMQRKIKVLDNKDILISIIVTLFTSLPWQIFTFIQYPEAAASAYKFNAYHFTLPLDGHGGDIWYHFNVFNTIYGSVASFLIIPSFFVFYKKGNNKKLVKSLLSLVIIVYLFFSITATKMPSFTIIISMIIFIVFASFFYNVMHYINQFVKQSVVKKIFFAFAVIVIVVLKFDVEYLQKKHTLWKDSNHYTRMLRHNKRVFKSLNLSSKTVLFNVKGRHYIEAMFYTGLPAYNFIPSKKQYQDIKHKRRDIAIFNSKNIEIPDYLKNDTAIIFINTELKGYK